MKRDDEFVELGRLDAQLGMPRYRFQAPHLQELYDKGFNEPWEAMKKGRKKTLAELAEELPDPARWGRVKF